MIPLPGRDPPRRASERRPVPKGPSMHRFSHIAFAVLVTASIVASSCASTEACLKEEDRRAWYLTKVEIDRCNLHNTGSLPVYHTSDGYSFGREPVAMGLMQASCEGLWTINVKFRETIVAFAGRTGSHEYEVLQLAGKADKSGRRILAQGAIPTDVMTGVATEVHVTKTAPTKLRVQPATRDKLLPYIFTFDCTPVQARPVSIPLL
jgi:hypothetical protein